MNLHLYNLFSDNMIFQANRPIRVFGEGDGVVSVKFAGKEKSVSSQNGKWLAEFDSMPYGGPYTMEICLGEETKTISDIMIGEVVLCTGQSNMQFTIEEEDFDPSGCEDNSMLRIFAVQRPEEYEGIKPENGWVPAKKENLPFWTAIGYHTGEYLQKKTGIAVGIIACSQGASVIQSWIPEDLLQEPQFRIPDDQLFIDHHNIYKEWNGFGMLYHFMFEHLVPFSVGSVMWYQGESNTSVAEAKVYLPMLKKMIEAWRKDLQYPELPFLVIQICDYDDRKDEGWKLVQSAQLEVEKAVPNTRLVLCSDVCSHENIHPPRKSLLSQRLAEVICSVRK